MATAVSRLEFKLNTRLISNARVVLFLLAAGACARGDRSRDPVGPDDPTNDPPVVRVAKMHTTQALEVGKAFEYDATLAGTAFHDTSGAPLTYSVVLAPHPNGLVAQEGVITGTPVSALPMTVSITAKNVKGGMATSSFLMFAFDSGLVEPVLPQQPFMYGELPVHFSSLGSMMVSDNTPPNNVITNDIAALGRVLFYDTRLSRNDRIACGSCHLQQFGFADTARFSRGFEGGRTRRHAMALANARFYRPARFFWDERAATLEDLALMPVQDPVEMGLPLAFVVPKLSVTGYYQPLFQRAFGSPEITLDKVSKAIAQFVRSLVSYRSAFDQPLLATGNLHAPGFLTTEELHGLNIFQSRCFVCHTSAGQVAFNARNNGIDSINADIGAGEGRFKVPSLRNIAVTAPYMHDGRFRTLEEVIEFYNSGVQDSHLLDGALRDNNGPTRLHLTSAEKAALLAFLRTLTDETFLTEARFGDPFKRVQSRKSRVESP